MKLNKDGITELRKKIKEEIEEKIDTYSNLSINEKLLNTLLFDYKEDENGNTVKYLVWTGKFLEYIDLSETDFSCVNWDARDEMYEESNHYIDLSNTNAKIDFSKSYGKIIRNCNFSSMYSSIENIDSMDEIYNSNFRYTSIDFSKFFNKIQSNPYKHVLQNCNLEYVEQSVLAYEETCECENKKLKFEINESTYNAIIGTDFTRTFIKFECDLSSPSNVERVVELIKNNRIGECYLNGKEIHSKEVQESIKEKKILEYEEYKKKLIKSIF